MRRFRIIPSLLIDRSSLVKGVHFTKHKYVGDPLNAVSIFNEKEVDEIVLLDRSAYDKGIDFALIERVAAQAFMPLAYGGGIKSVQDANRLLQSGVEKVVLNSLAVTDPDIVAAIASRFGSSSTIVSVDVRSNYFGGPKVWYRNASVKAKTDSVLEHVRNMEHAGAGEILLTSVNHEGTMKGFDLDLIHKIADTLTIPLIASGGAGNMDHVEDAIKCGASAVALGSMCVFWGRHRAVLINYPQRYKNTLS